MGRWQLIRYIILHATYADSDSWTLIGYPIPSTDFTDSVTLLWIFFAQPFMFRFTRKCVSSDVVR